MQRFALFLGHPSRSIAFVLGALLISAGIGSYVGPKKGWSIEAVLISVTLTILGAAYLYPWVVQSFLGHPLWLRCLWVVAMIFPLGFFMGIPFPTGIRRIATQRGKDTVPWMWSINGGTTVIGSVLAIIIAMATNFTTVLSIAAAGYLIALLSIRSA